MATGSKKQTPSQQQPAVDTAYLNSDSGPANPPAADSQHPALQRALKVGDVVDSMPHNTAKRAEYGVQSMNPVQGATVQLNDEMVTASSLSEAQDTGKTGPRADIGVNQAGGALPRVRADNTGQGLTTNQGVPIADNQNSLKAGLRGPALLKDFILREKITHFDHERIPERVVHARGSGAHGFFECYDARPDLTCATVFAEKGKRTPVFARFSTVVGERGSKDTARDVRGFAVKFYTDQGIWDLVGNNIPVFFVQDAMKFPDLVHAAKPEPHHAMPQAASAHDTFWDFISLMPESMHTVMWQMSGRGIPRSYRMMDGFGVHTFRFVTAEGQAKLVKFHWKPKQGTHALVWDEVVKIAGADPDFHRRDLWEAIDAGEYPEWEFGVQVFDEEWADSLSFDVLDPTKIIPEELVPVTPLGRMVLNRNPDNFFAETEQVAFCTAHVVPGIDFTNDPLLAGRLHSYVDTQLILLGGPNFHEIPINAPLAPVHNNQRDGHHRQAIHRGKVAYEPNSLAGGCPFQLGSGGYRAFPEPVSEFELRGKPEKFAEHYNQPRMFYLSQTDAEKGHIVDAFAFELSKVTVPGIRRRMVAMLRNVSDELAVSVANKLGITDLPEPLPKANVEEVEPELTHSDYLSLVAQPGTQGIRTRKVALMVDNGVDFRSVQQLAGVLSAQGAIVRLVGPHVGMFGADEEWSLDADASFENSPSVLFDAVAIPDGAKMVDSFSVNGLAQEFVRDSYRHNKPILAVGAGMRMLEHVGIPLNKEDTGLIASPDVTEDGLARFIQAIEQHRHPVRETQPPVV